MGKRTMNYFKNYRSIINIFKIFIIAIVIFMVAISAFLYFNLYLPAGVGIAGPNVPMKPFKKLWSDKPVLLLGIGDSITDGFGAPKGYAYFDRLVKNPINDSNDMIGKTLSTVFPKLTFKNIAVSFTVSKKHLEIIKKFPSQPNNVLGIVVMTTGGNDLIHNYGRTPPKECAMYGATLAQARPWIMNYKNRLEEMIIELTSKFPGGCQIFLANIYDPTDGIGNTNQWFTGMPPWPDGLLILAEYNKTISECSGKFDNVHIIDINSAFLGHGINCRKFWTKHYQHNNPHYWYYRNIEDPNPRGYDAVRRLFLLKMIEVFGKGDYAENGSSTGN